MQLLLLDQTIYYPNEIGSIEECINKISQVLELSQFVFSHLEIDGVEVYEDFQDYLIARVTDILVIKVRVRTYKQLLNETVLSLEQYLIRMIPETLELANQFYQGPVQESWSKLEQVLEGLQWVLQAIYPIYTLRGNELPYKNSLEYSVISTNLSEKFHELEISLSRSDLVLTGDLLKYEIVEQLSQLNTIIQTTIENEVVRNDLN